MSWRAKIKSDDLNLSRGFWTLTIATLRIFFFFFFKLYNLNVRILFTACIWRYVGTCITEILRTAFSQQNAKIWPRNWMVMERRATFGFVDGDVQAIGIEFEIERKYGAECDCIVWEREKQRERTLVSPRPKYFQGPPSLGWVAKSLSASIARAIASVR